MKSECRQLTSDPRRAGPINAVVQKRAKWLSGGNVNQTKALLLGATFLTLSSANAALAADAPVANDNSTVAEVVVTAQLRAQSLQKVPATISAITSATLSQAGVVDMHGISTLVPALAVVQTIGPVNQSYRIRGMGSDPNIPTFEPDVALFVDGVYMPRSGLSVDDLVDVARVEVVEGPQSTLYGKNATAGVVNVITKGPSDHWEGSVEGSFSDLDSSIQALVYRFAGTVTGPINDHLRFRLSAVTYNQGASYLNLEPGAPNANDLNRYAVRGEMDADLWSGANLRLAVSRSQIYNTRNGDSDNLYYTFPPTPNNAYKLDFGPLGKLFGITPCPDNNPNDRVICTTSPWTNASWTDVASATLTSPVGRDTLTAITAWSDYRVQDQNNDIAQVLLPLIDYDDTQKGQTISQEVRLVSPSGGAVEWLAGGYYEHETFNRGDDGHTPTFVLGNAAPFVPLSAPLGAFKVGLPGDEGFLNSSEDSDYGALFGQLRYRFSQMFSLSAGLRGQIDHKTASIDNSYIISPLTPTLNLGPCGKVPVNILTASLTPINAISCPMVPVNGAFDHTTSYLTWNVTGEFHPTSSTMAYATVSRGGKSFGYNLGFGNTPASQREFTDEFVNNYEVGVKTTLLDGRARLAASMFLDDDHNYQNAGFVGLQFLVDNAQHVTFKGVEENADLILGHGFTANAGIIYVDAVYNTYTGGSCYFGEVPNNGHGGCNLSGENLPLTPHWRSNTGLQFQQPVSFGDFYSRIDWVWQSSMLANTNLDPRSFQNDYSIFNVRLGVKSANGLDVALWVNNVFDATYSQADYVSNLFGANDPAYQRYLGRPREFGVTVGKRF
jgi:outer membrane receptor protein involved in Fe transport